MSERHLDCHASDLAGIFSPAWVSSSVKKCQGPDFIIQLTDHVSRTAGNHSLKFGGELHRNNVTNASYGKYAHRQHHFFLGGVLLPPQQS